MSEEGLETPERPPLKWGYALFLSAVIIVLDQVTKYWVQQHFQLYEFLPITSFFNLTLAYNTGAAFSFLADAGGWQRWFLAVVAAGMSVFLIVWLRQLRQGQTWQAVALALVLGGAIGNLWDRLAYGYVIDFLDFYWGSYHWPAFNVADSAITVGAIMLMIDLLFLQNSE